MGKPEPGGEKRPPRKPRRSNNRGRGPRKESGRQGEPKGKEAPGSSSEVPGPKGTGGSEEKKRSRSRSRGRGRGRGRKDGPKGSGPKSSAGPNKPPPSKKD